jgi:hypothetical protein
MTVDEAILLDVIADAPLHRQTAHETLSSLLHVRYCLGVLSSAEAVAAAFADLGMPLNDCNKRNRDEPF